MLSGHPGQLDFSAGQVSLHSHLLKRQEPRHVVCQLSKKSNPRLAQGKQNLRAACPRGKMDFKFFSSPVLGAQISKNN